MAKKTVTDPLSGQEVVAGGSPITTIDNVDTRIVGGNVLYRNEEGNFTQQVPDIMEFADEPKKTTIEQKVDAAKAVADPFSKENIRAKEQDMRAEAIRLGGELGLTQEELDQIPLTTFEEQQAFIERMRAQRASEGRQIDISERLDVGSTELTKQALRSQQEAVLANFAQGREGATTSTAPQAMRTIDRILSERKAQADLRLEQAQLSRQDARARLEEAKKGDSQRAIQLAQSDLRNAESAIREAENASLDLALKASKEVRDMQDQKIQNAEAFTTFVGSNPDLTPQGAMALASQFGLSTADAAEYYLATESIRKDKTLDQEAKQVALEQAQFDFQDKVMGGAVAQANKLAYYEEQVRQGGDPEQLAVLLDIPNEFNPVYQADLRLKQAETQMQMQEASGQPVGWKERQEYMEALAEKQQATGKAEVVVPTKTGRFGITPTSGGIIVDVVEGDYIEDIGTDREEGQCGAFVNDVLGTSIPDLYTDKAKLVTEATAKPGMFFVQQTNTNYGHVGIVESINADGTINVVEANYGKPGTIGRRENLPVSDFTGFGYPPNKEELTIGNGEVIGGIDTKKVIRQAATLANTKYGKEQIQEDVQAYADDGDIQGLRDYMSAVAYGDLGAEEQKGIRIRNNIVFQGQKMKDTIQEYLDAGGDLGIFAGTKTKVSNKINAIKDTKRFELAQTMMLLVEDFARAQSGAAIPDFERASFEKMLPNVFDNGKIVASKIDAFTDYVTDLKESDLRNRLGNDVYEAVYGTEEALNGADGLVVNDMQITFDVDSPVLPEISKTLEQKGLKWEYDKVQEFIDADFTLDEILQYLNNLPDVN